MFWMRYFGDQDNTCIINTSRHYTCLEELLDCTDNILFQHGPVALKESTRETIRARGFERTNLKKRITLGEQGNINILIPRNNKAST